MSADDKELTDSLKFQVDLGMMEPRRLYPGDELKINGITVATGAENPYVSPKETVELEPIYDEDAPDGYYIILGGTAVFMLAIGFFAGVAFMAFMI